MFLTLILYAKEGSSLPLLLICEVHSNREKPGSYHPPSIYFIVRFQDTCGAVSELLTPPPRETTLWTGVQLHTDAYALVLQTHFQCDLGPALFLLSIQRGCLYICSTVRFFHHSAFHPRISQAPK